eukprot:TRINITY_DN1371_c0_g1_i1.p1 TRINITY_DN1371_c0_g1~~TRINITY_DN1371_c0_g1_i1.p1  ORF type:complete len:439 (+),score=26.83 TRINITY_DN1371_c0_g1_i1:438-1754(+)
MKRKHYRSTLSEYGSEYACLFWQSPLAIDLRHVTKYAFMWTLCLYMIGQQLRCLAPQQTFAMDAFDDLWLLLALGIVGWNIFFPAQRSRRRYRFIKSPKLTVKSKISPPSYRSRRRIQRRNQSVLFDEEDFDIYEHTGLSMEQFLQLFEKVKDDIRRPRLTQLGHRGRRQTAVSLSTASRLLMFLVFLRKAPHLSLLARTFKVTKTFVHRDRRHILPIVHSALNFIDPFRLGSVIEFVRQVDSAPLFPDAAGAVDCTAHRRDRVHPGQALFYRGDKGYHFILAQVSVLLCGLFTNLQFFCGHNNDQGAFNLSGIKSKLDELDLMFLGDGGYKSNHVYSQYNIPEWMLRELHKLRSIVEIAIGYVGTFQFANARCKMAPHFQQYMLRVCYELAQWKMLLRLLKPSALPVQFRERVQQLAEENPFCDWDAELAALRNELL